VALIIGVDVGGTFTDVVFSDGGHIEGRKVPTTVDQAVGVGRALSEVGADESTRFLHGTTVGTNALIESAGARVALVTTAGFEDIVEIGRQARPSLYDPFVDRPEPLVPRDLRFPLTDDRDALVRSIMAGGAEVVAVALIRSYREPAEEREAASDLSRRTGLPVSVGAEISPAFREFERVATTVLNAYLTPVVSGYLERIDTRVPLERRQVMTSSGGLLPVGSATHRAGRLVLSGPAAGVIAASAMATAKGHPSVISFDMGGTSTDVCRIGVDTTSESNVARAADRVNRVPSLPVRTIGAGGGSIAWLDGGGALRVGPRSAGSSPGPAAYGHGGRLPTVTDANVALGRIPEDIRFGGSIPIELGAASHALDTLGAALGLDTNGVAAGVIDVVDAHMERALRSVSVEEGADPRRSALVAFGGAGGLHALRLARELGMGTVLIPPLSGVFSALGLLMATPRSDVTATVMLAEGSDQLSAATGEIVDRARQSYRGDHQAEGTELSSFGDLRYAGQSHELTVSLKTDWAALRQSFEAEHQRRFGFIRADQPIELVNVSAEVSGVAPMEWSDLPSLAPLPKPIPLSSSVHIDGETLSVDTYSRKSLPAAFEITGPALVIDADAVVWLDRGGHLSVHDDGTLEMSPWT
jgi:N-methylhydantoinase A